jgi:hypothetical protein
MPTDASIYPYNNVKQTRAGHVFEVDDTLGNERIHEQHKSGTSRTVKPDGTAEGVIHGDSYTIVHGSGNVTISGSANITVNGTCRMTVNGNYDMQVNGDMNTTVAGAYNLKVGANQLNETSGDYAQNIVGNKKSVIGNGMDITVSAGGARHKVLGGDNEVTVTGSNIMIVTEESKIDSKKIDHTGTNQAKFSSKNIEVRAASELNTYSFGDTKIFAPHVIVDTPLTDFTGNVKVDGTVDATNNITSMADVRSNKGSISLTKHKHLGDGDPSKPAPTSRPLPG